MIRARALWSNLDVVGFLTFGLVATLTLAGSGSALPMPLLIPFMLLATGGGAYFLHLNSALIWRFMGVYTPAARTLLGVSLLVVAFQHASAVFMNGLV